MEAKTFIFGKINLNSSSNETRNGKSAALRSATAHAMSLEFGGWEQQCLNGNKKQLGNYSSLKQHFFVC